MRKNVFYVFCCLFVISSLSLTGCKDGKSELEEVVIYTSLDKVFSEPILDVDIEKVSTPEMIEKHPGLKSRKGRIGFCPHTERVEFRNIRIK